MDDGRSQLNTNWILAARAAGKNSARVDISGAIWGPSG
jgi:hypothetical protein